MISISLGQLYCFQTEIWFREEIRVHVSTTSMSLLSRSKKTCFPCSNRKSIKNTHTSIVKVDFGLLRPRIIIILILFGLYKNYCVFSFTIRMQILPPMIIFRVHVQCFNRITGYNKSLIKNPNKIKITLFRSTTALWR